MRAVRQARRLPAPPRLRPQVTAEIEAGVLVMAAADFALGDWGDPFTFSADLIAVGRAVHAAVPDRAVDVVVVLTEAPTAQGPAYLPLANDVRGLGYGHLGLAPDEVFRTGAIPWIDGVIHLGQLGTYAGPEGRREARYQFLHELGHRWGVYARFRPEPEGPTSDAWLGRDCAHWSFFTDTGGSAMEGNRWGSEGAGWRAEPTADWGYNDFDRYLMGFAPAEAVAPAFFLPEAGGWDCDQPRRNGVENPAWQPPAGRGGGPTEAVGPAQTVTIEQLVAAEGPRVPAWPDSQQVWSVVFVLLTDSAHPPVAEADALRRRLTLDWVAAATHPGLPPPTLISHVSGQPEAPDVGVEDAGLPDAHVDAAPDAEVADAGGPDARPADMGVGGGRDGGCTTAPPGLGPTLWVLLLGGGLRRRR